MTEQFFIQKSMIGYFASPTQRTAAYDPLFTALCPYCGEHFNEADVRTYSFTAADPDERVRSCFYRTHRTCDEAAGPSKSESLFYAMTDAAEAA